MFLTLLSVPFKCLHPHHCNSCDMSCQVIAFSLCDRPLIKLGSPLAGCMPLVNPESPDALHSCPDMVMMVTQLLLLRPNCHFLSFLETVQNVAARSQHCFLVFKGVMQRWIWCLNVILVILLVFNKLNPLTES